MENKRKAWLALAFISLAWGTTFLGIKVCVDAFPPFLMAGSRHLIAGLIILLISLGNAKAKDLSIRNLLRNMLIGFLLMSAGNGLVSWAEQYIPSGVAALICAMMPILAVMANVFFNKNDKVNLLIVVGILLGFFGVAINFKNNIADLNNVQYITGILVTLFATTAWGIGSVISRKNNPNANPIFNSAIQVVSGGLLLLLLSPLVDDYASIKWDDTIAWIWFAYLIIIGSVAAYTAYMYALKELPVGVVMIYAYINPLVAVVLGWWFLNEDLTIYTALSFATIVAGIYLVNKGYRRQHLKKAS